MKTADDAILACHSSPERLVQTPASCIEQLGTNR
jgi:hypothetical protein